MWKHLEKLKIHSFWSIECVSWLVKKIKKFVLNEFSVYESCLEGKMTKRPFNAKGYRAKDLLELIHSDVCGPMSIQARGGYEYFITFSDGYSRFGYV